MLAFLGPIGTAISGVFGNVAANIETYAIIFAVILGMLMTGYVWYKLSSDESTIATLTNNNKTLTTAVSTLQTTTQGLQSDITMVQSDTAKANVAISAIQVSSAKKAQVIQSTNYNAEATANSKNLTTSVNAATASMFNQIETDSVIAPVGATK